jgi:hypothetical protein
LLVVANHPGTFDGLVIAAQLPRDDVKIVVRAGGFFRRLYASEYHLMYSPPPEDVAGRMLTVRRTIRHLQAGGAMIIFPGYRVSPDPAVQPGAAEHLDTWSRSLDIILRRVPATRVVVTIVSGVLSRECWRHPITHLRRGRRERQMLAEFLQVIRQTLLKRDLHLVPRASFSPPVTVEELGAALPPGASAGKPVVLPALIARAKEALAEHMAWPEGE